MIAIMLMRIAQIFEGGTWRHLAPGEPLFHSGDPVRSMWLVTEGDIQLIRQTAAGSRMILQHARSGEVLAEASVFASHYHCDARSAGKAVLLSMPVEQFRQRVTFDPALAEAWVTHLAHAVQSARLRAEIRTLRTVAERLDAWTGEGHKLPPKGEVQDLAAELGVTREALYRELSRRRLSVPQRPTDQSRKSTIAARAQADRKSTGQRS